MRGLAIPGHHNPNSDCKYIYIFCICVIIIAFVFVFVFVRERVFFSGECGGLAIIGHHNPICGRGKDLRIC